MEHDSSAPSLPPDFHLLEGERLINVQRFEPREPDMKASSLRELYRLTNASGASDVGNYGPAIAALSLETNGALPEHQGLFNAIFGRDSLRVALDLIDHYPRLARATVKKLAELQGVEYSAEREEEPGRIAHEIRDPEEPIAKKLTAERGWGWPYYGSVDATPEFIRTIAAYCRAHDESGSFLFESYTNKSEEVQPLHGSLVAAVDWLTRRQDANHEGLIEHKAAIPRGIENQVWKDSWDAYHHADGTIANHDQGVSSIEVQTVTHDALLDAADLYERVLDKADEAQSLRERAQRLSQTILSLFWTEEGGGYFVLGCDRDDIGNLRQLKIKTSNMGHILNSTVLDGNDDERVHKRAAVLRQLQSPELLSTGGIRTLATDEVRYREGAYHNGSVWIWDTHHIAKGARRFVGEPQFLQFADDLDRRILKVAQSIGGFPEYVRGGNKIEVNTHTIDVEDTRNHHVNRVEQPPQEVQAWTVAAILAAKYHLGKRALLVK